MTNNKKNDSSDLLTKDVNIPAQADFKYDEQLKSSSGVQIYRPKSLRPSAEQKAANEKILDKIRERDLEKVEVIFKHIQIPGGDLCTTMRKHKGEAPTRYYFVDGQKHVVPRYVVDHINNGCVEKEFKYQEDAFGPHQVPIVNCTGLKPQRFMMVTAP